MPRARFDWSTLPLRLQRSLHASLRTGGDPAKSFKRAYGARPDEQFVKEHWTILRDEWLAKDPTARKKVTAALRDAKLGHPEIPATSAKSEWQYLQSCRNTARLRAIVLDQLLALGTIGSDGSVTRAEQSAQEWAAFERALALSLAQFDAGQYLILETTKTKRYVQFAQSGKGGVHAETVCNNFLPDNHRLDDVAISRLKSLGWQTPAALPDDERGSGSPNYYRTWRLPVPYNEIAQTVVRTLIDALEVRSPMGLEYEAFESGNTPVILANLGITRRVKPPKAVRDQPMTLEDLFAQVKAIVKKVVASDVVLIDEKGDIPIFSKTSVANVHVFRDRPTVRVYSVVLQDFGSPPDILETVNAINCETAWVKALWEDGALVLRSDLVAESLSESQLLASISSVLQRADQYGPLLQSRYGGKTAFGPAQPVVHRSTSPGYL